MANLDVYQMVTNKVMEQLEQGVCPWQRPWTGVGTEDGGSINYVTRKPYSLLNQILLGKAGEWLTFKQIKDCGGSLKKGAKGGMVVYYGKFLTHKEVKADDETTTKVEEREIPILKYYYVFHIDDTTGIESKIEKKDEEPVDTVQPIEEAENIINDYVTREGIKFQNDQPSNRAFYASLADSVTVPMISQYADVEEYYSTTFHELTHSTGNKKRLNRIDGHIVKFGDKNYSREELVAEMGAAMLCNVIGISTDKAFKNSVSYIKSWLRALANDKKMVVWASSRAEKAAKYILNQ